MESVISTREEVQRFLYVPTIEDDLSDVFEQDGGSGSGYGDGYGYGSGDGDGTFYRDGYGFGYGTGSGSDECYGYCSGYYQGIKTLNGNIVDYVDYLPTIITQVRGNLACGYIVKDDLTLKPCYIAKSGNSFAHGKTLKYAFADAERKEIDKMPIEKRVAKFVETFGSLDTEHTGKEFYEWHHILTGSCRMGRDMFCKAHDINLEKKYTVRYFLDITDESYGNDVIKLIRKEYKEI